MNSHRKNHGNITPEHECQFCIKKFLKSTSLQQHIESVHEKAKFILKVLPQTISNTGKIIVQFHKGASDIMEVSLGYKFTPTFPREPVRVHAEVKTRDQLPERRAGHSTGIFY